MSMVELAKKINRKGDQFIKQNGSTEFHKRAAELLSESNIIDRFDHQEIIACALNAKHQQYFKRMEFSDLPVTLAQTENCFIEVYFWRRRPTVIHNHHFVGAFMCLEGNNVDLEFSFKKERRLGRFHELGTLDIKRSKQMGPGDITEIAFMDKFIHQNHHQAELTVNLCFRTPQEPSRSLSNYLFSGLRFEKNDALLGRVGRLLRFVDIGLLDSDKTNIGHDDAINFLLQTYDTSSSNPRLLKLRTFLEKRVKSELDVDIFKLIKQHDQMMEKIENDYE